MRPGVETRGRKQGMGSHQSADAETVEWYTPPGLFDALGLRFDLDPAAPKGGLDWIPARRFLSIEDDGLSLPWEGRVWLNPPYGPHTAVWLERFIEHGDGLALVFARTDTEWFHRCAIAADALCFVRGRLTFVRPDGDRSTSNAGAPSLLIACGDECVAALDRAKLGLTLAINAPHALQGTLLGAAA